MGLCIEEQETNINFSRGGSRAKIYTSDSTMITKLDKLIRIENTEWKLERVIKSKNGEEVGRVYSCPVEFVSFRKKKVSRIFTDEEKKARREQLLKNRKAKGEESTAEDV